MALATLPGCASPADSSTMVATVGTAAATIAVRVRRGMRGRTIHAASAPAAPETYSPVQRAQTGIGRPPIMNDRSTR